MPEHNLLQCCSICNNQAPKYRCPRCACRTCSLNCYKRHQKWARCSGKRDPAAYVSRTDLYTASGVDRDYNFLAGVERGLAKAEENAKLTSITLHASVERHSRQVNKLQAHIQDLGVKLHKAAEGMSRARSNRTRWHAAHKCIMWTVEWIHPDLTREVGHCRATSSLSAAYDAAFSSAEKSRKRKVGDPENLPTCRAIPSRTATVAQPGRVAPSCEPSEADHEEPHDHSANSDQHYFYLVKPFTRGTRVVLIPLPSSSTLADCMRHREVFEYPTIQVLHKSTTSLPSDFELEAEDKSPMREIGRSYKAEMGSGGTRDTADDPQTWDQDWDYVADSKILASLQQDVNHVK